MRTAMVLAITLAISGVFAVSNVLPASAAKVVTKYGTYEGGCSGSSCLYKPMKKPHKAVKHSKAS
jgi:hypothetical protein